MCVIIYHPAGAKGQLKKGQFKALWEANPDGAGLWVERSAGTVEVVKGLMTFNGFWRALRDMDLVRGDRFAIHFRWGTHGGVFGRLTHPFFVDPKREFALSGITDRAVMHNGVLSHVRPGPGRSDTSEYVLGVLASRRALVSKRAVDRIASETAGSRMLIYQGGKVAMTGGWFERNGIYFSNVKGVTVYENC